MAHSNAPSRWQTAAAPTFLGSVGALLALLLVGLVPAPGTAATTLTVPACGGVLRIVSSIEELRAAVADINVGRLSPGSVIRLQAGIYRLDGKGRPLSFKDVAGTSEDCPIVLEGVGSATVIDGARNPDTHYFRHKVAAKSGLDTIEYVERDESVPGVATEGMPLEELINCFKVKRASWITLRNLSIRNCWPSALFVRDASYVTAQGLEIIGGTYAIVAFGRTHHLLVEKNEWIQDPTGDVWSRIPWGVSHHGSKSHLNGALVGGKDILGGVVVRGNRIRYAYNGVRIKAVRCRGEEGCARNMNVEIAGNAFEYVRDNPVEPEGHTTNWWIHHNTIYNAHAWFSFDGIDGGPLFVFANTGWFDDVPGRDCDDREWRDDRNVSAMSTAGKECARSRIGKVLKLGNDVEHPIYVFNNSWYLRSPVAGGGGSGPLRHWNNAIAYCRPVDGTCSERPFFSNYPGDEFRWDGPSHGNYVGADYEFRHDVSNHLAYPNGVQTDGFPVEGMHADDLGFEHAVAGDFRLRGDSPLKATGCVVAWLDEQTLECRDIGANLGPDVGAYQGRQPMPGPAFRHRDAATGPDTPYVERPRIVALDWSDAHAGRLVITFSVAVTADPAVRVTLVRSGREAPSTAECTVGDPESRLLSCVFAGAIVDQAIVKAIVLSRGIYRRDGERAAMTLWAATDPRLRYAE